MSSWVVAIACAISSVASAAGVIMPVYGNTSSQFNAAISVASKVATIAVINPSNGAGSSRYGSIASFASRMRGARGSVYGYISTAYGGASLDGVYAQVDKYKKWYGANGVYLDEMSDRTNKLSYYRSIMSYVRKKGMSVIGNPGTFVPSSYASVADILVTYEDPLSRGWNSHRPAAWTKGYAPSKFGAIVYAAPESSMESIVDRAVSLRYGWIFATDHGGADPFGRAPSYASALAAYVKSK